MTPDISVSFHFYTPGFPVDKIADTEISMHVRLMLGNSELAYGISKRGFREVAQFANDAEFQASDLYQTMFREGLEQAQAKMAPELRVAMGMAA